MVNSLAVVIAAGKHPASIPNLEVKTARGEGTALGRVWETSTPPQTNTTKEARPIAGRASFTFTQRRGEHTHAKVSSRNPKILRRLVVLKYEREICALFRAPTHRDSKRVVGAYSYGNKTSGPEAA